MPRSIRGWVAAVAASGAAGLGAALGVAACGSFGAASDPARDAATPDMVTTADGSGGDAGADGDGDGKAGPAPGIDASSCIDLVDTPPGMFVAQKNGTGQAAPTANGLAVKYPAGTAVLQAQWNHLVSPPANATGATIAIDAHIDMPAPLSTSPAGYAAFAGVTYGDSSMLDTAPTVVVALGAFSRTQSSMDLDVFAQGLAANAAPESAASFATVGLGAFDVHVELDVTWSATAADHASARLGDAGATHVTGRTLVTAAHAAAWTVSLGGSAQNNGATTITYRRLCVQPR